MAVQVTVQAVAIQDSNNNEVLQLLVGIVGNLCA